jgi:hypothetical protein
VTHQTKACGIDDANFVDLNNRSGSTFTIVDQTLDRDLQPGVRPRYLVSKHHAELHEENVQPEVASFCSTLTNSLNTFSTSVVPYKNLQNLHIVKTCLHNCVAANRNPHGPECVVLHVNFFYSYPSLSSSSSSSYSIVSHGFTYGS